MPLKCSIPLHVVPHSGFTEDFPPGLVDVVENANSENKAQQVVLTHIKVYTRVLQYVLKWPQAHSTVMHDMLRQQLKYYCLWSRFSLKGFINQGRMQQARSLMMGVGRGGEFNSSVNLIAGGSKSVLPILH